MTKLGDAEYAVKYTVSGANELVAANERVAKSMKAADQVNQQVAAHARGAGNRAPANAPGYYVSPPPVSPEAKAEAAARASAATKGTGAFTGTTRQEASDRIGRLERRIMRRARAMAGDEAHPGGANYTEEVQHRVNTARAYVDRLRAVLPSSIGKAGQTSTNFERKFADAARFIDEADYAAGAQRTESLSANRAVGAARQRYTRERASTLGSTQQQAAAAVDAIRRSIAGALLGIRTSPHAGAFPASYVSALTASHGATGDLLAGLGAGVDPETGRMSKLYDQRIAEAKQYTARLLDEGNVYSREAVATQRVRRQRERTGSGRTAESADRLLEAQQQRLRDQIAGQANNLLAHEPSFGPAHVAALNRQLSDVTALRSGIAGNMYPGTQKVTAGYDQQVRDAQRQTSRIIGSSNEERRQNMAKDRAITNDEQKARREETEARKQRKNSLVSRGGRALTWLAPQQGYWAASAMSELMGESALTGPAVAGVAVTAAAAGMALTVAAELARQSRQTSIVSAMVGGGNGAATRPLDQNLARQLEGIGAVNRYSPEQTFQQLQALAPYNLRDSRQVATAARLGYSISQQAQIDPTQGLALAGAMMAQLGMNGTQAAEQLTRMANAAKAVDASASDSAATLTALAPMMGLGTNIATLPGFSAAASRYGLRGADLAGPVFNPQGANRITMAALTGMTPEQFRLAQVNGGAGIANAYSQQVRALYAANGNDLTTTSMIAASLGYINPSGNLDNETRALLDGNALDAALTGAGSTASPSAAQAAAATQAAERARQSNAGFFGMLGTVKTSVGDAFASTLTDVAKNNQGLPGPLAGLLDVNDMLINLPVVAWRAGQRMAQLSSTRVGPADLTAPNSQEVTVNINLGTPNDPKGVASYQIGVGPQQTPGANVTVTTPNTPGSGLPSQR